VDSPSLVVALLLLLRLQVSIEDGFIGFAEALPGFALKAVRQ